MTYKNANVYMECSAMLIGNLEAMPKEKVDTYVTRPIAWVFGYLEDPRKLMFGTDWPVCLVAAEYEKVVKIANDYFSSFTKNEQDKVFGLNAIKFYNLR